MSEPKGIVTITAKALSHALGLPPGCVVEDMWQSLEDKQSDCFTMRVRGIGEVVCEGAHYRRIELPLRAARD